MPSRASETCLPTGTIREDREIRAKNDFDSLRLDIKFPETAVLLLGCKEKSIFLAAATALAKFATKSPENLEVLFDLEIVEKILPHVRHEDLYTRRFAAKLLAQMSAIPSVKNYLLETENLISHFAKILAQEEDSFMQEFSSLILAELSKDPQSIARFLNQCPEIDFLFDRLSSPDPDVKRNNIEIIQNLMEDFVGVEKIMTTNSFDFGRIFNLLNEPYPEIQELSLNVIGRLVSWNKDENMQNLFRESGGLETLLNLLENEEWEDLHSKVLKLISLACENSKTADLFVDIGGVRRIFRYLDATLNSKHFLQAFEAIVRLANSPKGRKELYTLEIVDYLLDSLERTTQRDVYEISCYGIGKMVFHPPAAREITAKNPLNVILDIFKNEDLKWSIRDTALFAIKELLTCDAENRKNFLQIDGQNYLLRAIRELTSEERIESRMMAVEALLTIISHSTLRQSLINADTVDVLCSPFQSSSLWMDGLKILCCSAISALCVDREGRQVFLLTNGPEKLYDLITDANSIPVRNAAVQLVQELSADRSFADSFVRLKFLPYMLNNRSTSRIVPTWETCIESLYDSHLPLKFAATGRLSLRDVTEDGFYAMRRNVSPFPVLEDFFRFKYFPMESVYVVNFGFLSEEKKFSTVSESGWSNDRRQSVSTEESKFDCLRADPYLQEYLDLFKCKFMAAETTDLPEKNRQRRLTDVSEIARRSFSLAKFVARQMSGIFPSTRGFDHQVEIHLRELRIFLESSVIPLGLIRVGSYLERALLFKTIADRIGLPAALVRGEYGKSWIEISVPEIVSPYERRFSAYLDEKNPCRDLIIKSKDEWMDGKSLIDDEKMISMDKNLLIKSKEDFTNEKSLIDDEKTIFKDKNLIIKSKEDFTNEKSLINDEKTIFKDKNLTIKSKEDFTNGKSLIDDGKTISKDKNSLINSKEDFMTGKSLIDDEKTISKDKNLLINSKEDFTNEKSLIDNEKTIFAGRRFILPTKLMRVNYIVDLVESPGRFIRIGSRQAEKYCEKRLNKFP